MMIVKNITNWFDKVSSYLVRDTDENSARDDNSEVVKEKSNGYKCSCKEKDCKHIKAVQDFKD